MADTEGKVKRSEGVPVRGKEEDQHEEKEKPSLADRSCVRWSGSDGLKKTSQVMFVMAGKSVMGVRRRKRVRMRQSCVLCLSACA